MQLFIDNWSSVLTAPLTAGSTQLSIAQVAASKLTGLDAGKFYELTLVETDAFGVETDWEVITVTAVIDNALMTAPRSGREWPNGTIVQARLTSASITRMLDDIKALQLRVTALDTPAGIALVSASGFLAGNQVCGYFVDADSVQFGSISPSPASVVPVGSSPQEGYGQLVWLAWQDMPGGALLVVIFSDLYAAGVPFVRMVIDGNDYLVSAAAGTDSDEGTTTVYWAANANPLPAGAHTVQFLSA